MLTCLTKDTAVWTAHKKGKHTAAHIFFLDKITWYFVDRHSALPRAAALR